MSARPYTRCLTAAQLQALAAKGIVQADIADPSCVSASLNTCLRDANDLLAQYPLYDTTRGVYTAWGAIPFTWDFEESPGDERWGSAKYIDEDGYLNGVYTAWGAIPYAWGFEDYYGNERWGSAEYVDNHGYRIGDQVLVIGNDGYLVILYTATADGPAPAGPFDPDLWTEVCRVTTSTPVGLPSIAELRSRYGYFDPDTGYVENNIVLLDSRCGDYTCAYIATEGVSANTVAPPTSPWLKLYCVTNGSPSQCGREVVCGPGRTVTDLSTGDTDLVCAPVPYWYRPVPDYDTTLPVES